MGCAEFKTLPTIKHYHGFLYTKVLEGERAYLYSQMGTSNNVSYEVFIRKVKPERYIKERKIAAQEMFPHDEAFGKWAWSFYTLEDAKNKFNDLHNNMNKKKNDIHTK